MSSNLALVLSGGGARAAYQVGVLRAIGELAPELRFPIVTGVSAGAINTVSLAASAGPLPRAVEELEECWRQLTTDQVYCIQPMSVVGAVLRLARDFVIGRKSGPPAVRGLLGTGPLRAFLTSSVQLCGIERNVANGTLRAVALSATSYTTGWTVTFVQGGPNVPMWTRAQRMSVHTQLTLDHVIASAAIPIVFPAVRIGAEYFGDGSVRQAAPLAPAIHLGAERVIAIGMRAPRPPSVPVSGDPCYPSSAEVFGLLLNSVFLDSLDTDAERLERLNGVLAAGTVPTDDPSLLRRVELLVLRPSRDLGAMARGYEVRLPPSISLLVRAMGGRRSGASDLVSYLLFDPTFTSDLVTLGYEDTIARRADVEAFLNGDTP